MDETAINDYLKYLQKRKSASLEAGGLVNYGSYLGLSDAVDELAARIEYYKNNINEDLHN